MTFSTDELSRLIKYSLPVTAFMAMAGCIQSNGSVSHADSNEANHLVIIGVPMLLGGFGSSVPVNEEYQITARHVAQVSWDLDVIHHPRCDLSLVRASSSHIPQWGLIYPDEKVTHEGHSLLGNKVKGEGKYLQDVFDTNTDCLYSLSDAPVMSGMSGGPVFNDKGEIVGITVAIVNNPEDLTNLRPAERYSQFVPATLIFDWLKQLGVDTRYASPELANIEVAPLISQLNQYPEYNQQNIESDPNTNLTQNPTNYTLLPFSTFNHYAAIKPIFQASEKQSIQTNSTVSLSGIQTEIATIAEPDTSQNQHKKHNKINNKNLMNEMGYNASYW